MELSNPFTISWVEWLHSTYRNLIILSHSSQWHGWQHTFSLFVHVLFVGYLPFAHSVWVLRDTRSARLYISKHPKCPLSMTLRSTVGAVAMLRSLKDGRMIFQLMHTVFCWISKTLVLPHFTCFIWRHLCSHIWRWLYGQNQLLEKTENVWRCQVL